ncbi:MAG TPA: hypothetical protein VNK23_17170 [Candidatus Dormibacteraeota bacterium]|nr:hypothetical protein [Candidatus Dormibacteraeota bacterium]
MFVVSQADLSFTDSFVNGLEGRDAMATKVVCAMSQVLASFAKVGQGGANFGMRCTAANLSGGGRSVRLGRARRCRHSHGIAKSKNEQGER